jgi:hypothetical protein
MICSSDNSNWPTSIMEFFVVQFYKYYLFHFDTKCPYDISFEFRLGNCFKRRDFVLFLEPSRRMPGYYFYIRYYYLLLRPFLFIIH